MMSASETVKKIRFGLFLNQEEFSKAVGVSKNAISYYERGVRNPSIKTIRKMKELAEKNGIEVKVEDFLD